MEGIVAGTLLSILIAFTNLTPLYGKIKNMTSEIAGKAGEGLHLEVFSGVLFFTFIFSCWVLTGLKLKSSHLNHKKTSKRK